MSSVLDNEIVRPAKRRRRRIIDRANTRSRKRPRLGDVPLVSEDELNDLAHAAIDAKRAFRKAERELEVCMDVVLDAMQKVGAVKHHVEEGFVEVDQGEARTTRSLDIEVLRKAADDKTFLDCVKVVLGKAEQHFSEKEMKRMCTETKGKVPDPKVIIHID